MPEKGCTLQSYRTGLKVLVADGRLKETTLTNDIVESVADELLTKEEVKDYFDGSSWHCSRPRLRSTHRGREALEVEETRNTEAHSSLSVEGCPVLKYPP